MNTYFQLHTGLPEFPGLLLTIHFSFYHSLFILPKGLLLIKQDPPSFFFIFCLLSGKKDPQKCQIGPDLIKTAKTVTVHACMSPKPAPADTVPGRPEASRARQDAVRFTAPLSRAELQPPAFPFGCSQSWKTICIARCWKWKPEPANMTANL